MTVITTVYYNQAAILGTESFDCTLSFYQMPEIEITIKIFKRN